MKTKDQIETELRVLVAGFMGDDVDPAAIAPDVPILAGGLGLDSMGAVNLMTQVEDDYAVRIDDDQFDVFDSLDRLVAFVAEEQGKAGR